MATFSLTSTLPASSPTSFLPKPETRFLSLPTTICFSHSLSLFNPKPKPAQSHPGDGPSVRAMALDFSGSLFEGGFDDLDNEPPSPPGPDRAVVDDKPDIECPPGLRQYEAMVVLRPDMTEDERVAIIQKYEELLVTGGAMYVEVYNRGVIPLSYVIEKKNYDGVPFEYFDGIYLLFTYFTKPESISALDETLKTDYDVIRSSIFKIRKRKY
ncbi:hypothetical protein Cgig2_026923 [Carnegiea gigantea]|uniref:Ribosomal protein S6 n=1 Tax=Carnegiea gigantea TaxID=171969 RepID=A0A9Q1KWT1_9CARY|nr:hypothetical protein Cgig2_026923 [Carnegiea gigantea]